MKNPDTVPLCTVEGWDWDKGKKTVLPSVNPKENYQWQEECQVSPDGNTMAAVVRLEDDLFTLRVNDEEWENSFEKAWNPRFSPDGRLTALVQNDDEWTVAVDDTPWEETFDFIWGTRFSPNGKIYASIQREMRYGGYVEGELWPELFENMTDPVLSYNGEKSAGVVQVKSLAQADLVTFRSGIYTVAVNGVAWEQSFMNVWTPVFDCNNGENVAAQIRLTPYEYTVAVNGKPWSTTYNCVWEPAFAPVSGALAVPVRQQGKWGVAIDAAIEWKPQYFQCWQLRWAPDAKKLWGIVAPEFGQFTVACNNTLWNSTFDVLTDLALSPDGSRAAVLASHKNDDFQIVVDGIAWQDKWDMAYTPIFSPDGAHVAALVRKGETMTVCIDGRVIPESFSTAWAPTFSPDSKSILLRGIQNGALVRIVMPLNDIL